MARVVCRLTLLTNEELAAGGSQIDLSVALIDAGIKVCEAIRARVRRWRDRS